MNQRAKIYIAVLAGSAAVVLLRSGQAISDTNWPILLGLTVTTAIFDLLRWEAPTGQSVTLGAAVKVIAIFTGGPALAVWVAALSQLIAAVILGTDVKRTLFNGSQMVLTVAVAGYSFVLLGGLPGNLAASLLPAIVVVLLYTLVNSFFVSALFSLLQSQSLLQTWSGMLKRGLETYLAVQAVGLVATFIPQSGGVAWAALLLTLLVLLQRVMGRYYGALKRNAESNRLREVQDSLLAALVAALDARDPYTRGHSARVSHYAMLIAQELNLDRKQLGALKYASILHDVGKIGIPDATLRKDGPLSPAERALMMEHPLRGVQLLERVNAPSSVIPAIKHHHEWYNGGGYPDGIKGSAIPLEARIIAVADAFDAMTSDRPYRHGMPWTEAVSRLKQGQSIQFDASVANAMIRVIERTPELPKETARLVGLGASELDGLLAPHPSPEAPARERAGRILPVHSKELSILYQLSLERRSLLDMSRTLHRVLEILYDTIGPHAYYIVMLDQASGDMIVSSAAGCDRDAIGQRWPVDTGLCGWVIRNGQPLIVPDVERDDRYVRINLTTRSELAVPLISENQVIGALNIESARVGAFSEDDVYLLTAVARQIADAIEMARAHERAAYAASHDGLTGALNRSTFYARLESELERADREGYPVAVALFDINDLKKINDNYGHLAGDQAVREFARNLRQNVRSTDLVARYGGDEFAVVMPRTNKQEALRRMADLSSQEDGRRIPAGADLMPLPTASWGVSCYPEDGETAEELVARADEGMYQDKKGKPGAQLYVVK